VLGSNNGLMMNLGHQDFGAVEFEEMEVSNDQSLMSVSSNIESGKNAVSQRRRNLAMGKANTIGNKQDF
jgi:hypothetical protein